MCLKNIAGNLNLCTRLCHYRQEARRRHLYFSRVERRRLPKICAKKISRVICQTHKTRKERQMGRVFFFAWLQSLYVVSLLLFCMRRSNPTNHDTKKEEPNKIRAPECNFFEGRLGYTSVHVPVQRIADFFSEWLNAIFLQLFVVIHKSFFYCFWGLGETLTPPLFLATVPPPSPPHHLSHHHHHHRRRRRRHRTSYPVPREALRIAYAARGGREAPSRLHPLQNCIHG